MRNSRVIALALVSLVSTASFAQAQSSAPAAGTAGSQQRGMKGERVKGQRMKGERGRGGMLRGITLSEAERTKLQAIHARYRTEGQSLRATLRPARAEVLAARQKGDTAALRALRERNAGGRTQLEALRTRQVAEIRGALTAENQKLFDANVAERAKRRAEWEKNGGKQGAHRGHRRAGRAGAAR